MIFSDAMLLAVSKLKIRKRRTIATIITASMLFGVVIAVFLIIFGLKSEIENASQSQFGNKVYIKATKDILPWNEQSVLARAVQLFNESSDPDKAYPLITENERGNPLDEAYLDTNNIFALQAINEFKQETKQQFENEISEKINDYNASMSPMNKYVIRGDTISINDDYTIRDSGRTVISIDPATTELLIETKHSDESAIPVIMSAENASQIFSFELPVNSHPTQEQLEEYMKNLRNRALGHTYEATISSEETTNSVKYQIVGLTAPLRNMTLSKSVGEVQPLDLIMSKLGANTVPFIIADPNSAAFIENYTLEPSIENLTIDLLIEFDREDEAAKFYNLYSCDATAISNCADVTIIEFANNHMFIRKAFNETDAYVTIFAVFFSIIAAVIMTATISKVIEDENHSIALYRAEGASTKNIVQIYAIYVVMLSLLICAAAFIVGLSLSGLATLAASDIVTSTVRVFYNIQSDIYVPLIGFDLRILLVFAAIVLIGLLSLVLVSDKIRIKNITKSLKS